MKHPPSDQSATPLASPAKRRTRKIVSNKYFVGAVCFVTATMTVINIQAVMMLYRHQEESNDFSSEKNEGSAIVGPSRLLHQRMDRLQGEAAKGNTISTLSKFNLGQYQKGLTKQQASSGFSLWKRQAGKKISNKNMFAGYKMATRRRTIMNHGDLPQLNCDKYGGPSMRNASEMVYWYDEEQIEGGGYEYAGELAKDYSLQGEQFLTFEPDQAGFNNKRMALESTVAIALATGRTLVMPPKMNMHRKIGGDHSFTDFYNLKDGSKSLKIISMEEFLLRNDTDLESKPPGNRTDWDGLSPWAQDELYKYLRSAAASPTWNMNQCILGIGTNDTRMEEILEKALKAPRRYKLNGPMPVDTSARERLRSMLSSRKKLCLFNETIRSSRVVHLSCNTTTANRLLNPFYSMVFVEDWKLDLFIKRFIRDHMRYTDFLQCAAARVVSAIRDISRSNGNPDGNFSSFHIRRGDFITYYPHMKASAEEIYEISKKDVPEKSTVFIATDERDARFFYPLQQHYNLLFLDDFRHVLGNDIMPEHKQPLWERIKSAMGFGTHSNSGPFLGMIDQLVASRGETFVGIYYSTFTGYINRMRGYQRQAQGRADGTSLQSFYYKPTLMRDQEVGYRTVGDPPWSCEWPLGYVDIDHNIKFRRNVTNNTTILLPVAKVINLWAARFNGGTERSEFSCNDHFSGVGCIDRSSETDCQIMSSETPASPEDNTDSNPSSQEMPKLWITDRLTMFETNIDDMTPEHLAHVIELLLSQGAADAWVTPIVMKKGRPAHMLHCACRCDAKTEDTLLELLFRHTTTLGIRISRDVVRAKLPRSFMSVSTQFSETKKVDVKIGRFTNGEIVSRKAEFDHCREIAREANVPIADVAEAAVRASKANESEGQSNR